MSNRQVFETAASAVEQWLEGKEHLRRVSVRAAEGGLAWDIDLQGEFAPVSSVRLVLPAEFPLEPCRFEVDAQLELKLPHVERGGKLCLGLWASPSDLEAPIAAVLRAMETLQDDFLAKLQQPDWAESEFHKERMTYWSLHCTDPRRATRLDGRIGRVHVDTSGLAGWAYGTVAGYLHPGTKHGRFYRQVIACNGVDPDAVSRRHGWAQGTVVKGHALIVRLPVARPWTPTTWPKDAKSLNQLVASATDGQASLEGLFARARGDFKKHQAKHKFRTTHTGRQVPQPSAAPQLVVLFVQGSATYGFQVMPTFGLTARGVSIEPFEVCRMDPDWSLARDHGLPQLQARRSKRVLLLGTGSLGSFVALLLARAGIGHMTLVDSQLMEAGNTSRHVLGLQHVGHAKAPELADELKRAVPGIDVVGVRSDAGTWIGNNATLGAFDLVFDCTAERGVRNAVTLLRDTYFGKTPVVHAWLEPLCSAGHVVLSQPEVPWPIEDPANDLVNASDLSIDETRVDNPACSAGFHPYGAADVTQVAAFVVERVLAAFDDPSTPSTVWSWVRAQAFFDALPLTVKTRSIVPQSGGKLDTATTTRSLSDVLGQR